MYGNIFCESVDMFWHGSCWQHPDAPPTTHRDINSTIDREERNQYHFPKIQGISVTKPILHAPLMTITLSKHNWQLNHRHWVRVHHIPHCNRLKEGMHHTSLRQLITNGNHSPCLLPATTQTFTDFLVYYTRQTELQQNTYDTNSIMFIHYTKIH